MVPFQWWVPTRLHFGQGEFRRAGQLAAPLGRRALIVTARSSTQREGYFADLQSQLRQQRMESIGFHAISSGPTTNEIDAAAAVARNFQADLVIALGGGSAMDAGKAVAGVAPGTEPTESYLSGHCEVRPDALPVLAIPTVAGSGSEMNKSALVTDPHRHFKDGIRSPWLFPKLAIVDPGLTWSVPAAVTAQTGFDILAHAIESYVSPRSQPISDFLAIDAIQQVTRWLPIVLEQLDHPQGREALSLASSMMGFNLGNVGTCLPHRLDKALCALHPEIPHGRSVAMFYPLWADCSCLGAADRFANVATWLETGSISGSIEERALSFGSTLEQFRRSIGVADSLSDVGLSVDQLDLLIERVAGDLSVNPVPLSREQLPELLRSAIVQSQEAR